jgi:hypothetical protein
MNTLEFLDYIPASKDDRHLGVASIKWGGLILRFKAQNRTDGKGFFITTASFKIKDPVTLDEKYVQAFDIDSRSEHDRIINFVTTHVRSRMGMTSVHNVNVDAHYAQQKASLPLEYPEQVQQNLPF